MRLRFAPFFPLLAILIPLASAVFADEAYQIDYQHVLFGSPQRHTTFFHRPSAASKASLLYTLSEKLVLGAVNPKDGAVIWRQWLKNNVRDGNGKGFLKSVDGEDVVVSAVDERVRAWDASHGKLVWEWIANEVVRGLEVLDIEGKRGDVIASTERDGKSFVTRLAASSGEVVWQYIDERYNIHWRRSAYCVSFSDTLQWRPSSRSFSFLDTDLLYLPAFSVINWVQNQSHNAGYCDRQVYWASNT